jgi:phage tail-like protein
MPVPKDAVTGDPLASFHFMVSIGKVSGYFTEVTGIGSETETIEYKIMSEGAKQPIIRKIPGRLKWSDITLKRGITSNMDFYEWRKQVENGSVDQARLDGTITMLSQDGIPVAEWTFLRGWPSKISGPSIKADGNEVGVEELTIVHEGIMRVK